MRLTLKLNLLMNYFAVFLLSAVAGSLYFSSEKPLTDELTIPYFVEININQQKFITQIKEIPQYNHLIDKILKDNQINFQKRISPVYTTLNANYLISFFKTSVNDIQFAIFKKQTSEFQIMATFKVMNSDQDSIQLSYGEIKFLNQEQFNMNALKLAQTLELEQNL